MDEKVYLELLHKVKSEIYLKPNDVEAILSQNSKNYVKQKGKFKDYLIQHPEFYYHTLDDLFLVLPDERKLIIEIKSKMQDKKDHLMTTILNSLDKESFKYIKKKYKNAKNFFTFRDDIFIVHQSENETLISLKVEKHVKETK